MSERRRPIAWGNYFDDIVGWLASGASAKRLAELLNEKHALGLTKNNVISAMRGKDQDSRMQVDGPLLRLIKERLPDRAAALEAAYRNRWTADGWERSRPARDRTARAKAMLTAYKGKERIYPCKDCARRAPFRWCDEHRPAAFHRMAVQLYEARKEMH
jgi:hypothetical protein